jgi:hypothetical protein
MGQDPCGGACPVKTRPRSPSSCCSPRLGWRWATASPAPPADKEKGDCRTRTRGDVERYLRWCIGAPEGENAQAQPGSRRRAVPRERDLVADGFLGMGGVHVARHVETVRPGRVGRTGHDSECRAQVLRGER